MKPLTIALILITILSVSIFGQNETLNSSTIEEEISINTLLLNESLQDQIIESHLSNIQVIAIDESFNLSENIVKEHSSIPKSILDNKKDKMKKKLFASKQIVDDLNIDASLNDIYSDDNYTYVELTMYSPYKVWFMSGNAITPILYEQIDDSNEYVITFNKIESGILHVGAESDQWEFFTAGNNAFYLPTSVSTNTQMYGGVTGAGNATDNYMIFDGSNDYIAFPKLNLSGDRTFSFWFKIPSDGNTAIGQGTAINNRWHIQFTSTHLIVYILESGQANIPYLIEYNLTPDTWYYSTVVSSVSFNANEKVHLYLNGELVGKVSSRTIPEFNTIYNIGKYYESNWVYKKSSKDRIQIFNESKDSTWVSNDYNAGRNGEINTSDSSLVYYNDMSGLTDLSGSNRQLSGYTISATNDNSYYQSDTANVDNYLQTTWTPTTNFTWNIWINISSYGNNAQIMYDTSCYVRFRTRTSPNIVEWSPNCGITNFQLLDSTHTNQWRMLTVESTGSTQRLYVDGVNIINSSTAIGGALSGTLQLFDVQGGSSVPFNGYISGVSIWNRSLKASEIAFMYDQRRMFNPHVNTFNPPEITNASCTLCTSENPYTTSETLPMFNIKTSSGAKCKISIQNSNFTAMPDYGKCTSADHLSHTCTLSEQEELYTSNPSIYISCANYWFDMFNENSSIEFQMNITNLYETSLQAIENGIKSTSVWPEANIYSNQLVFMKDETTGNEFLGTVDMATVYGDKRWLFTYIPENGNFRGLFNITPSIYSLEVANLSSSKIRQQVSALINETVN